MAVFPATFFTFSTRYPESGQRIRFGNSYAFTAAPTSPDQRQFILRLQGMQYFVNSNGTLNTTTEPGRNLAVLEAFYNTHKLYMEFDFPHPVYGTVVCKFLQPLEIPEGIKGGNGVIDSIEVTLEEQP